MATKDKSKGRRYTASERARTLEIYREYGPAVASKRMGIPYETVRRWAKNAGETPPEPAHDQLAKHHAMAAARATSKWAEVREQEADAAGHAAQIARERLLDVLVTDDHQMLRSVVNAYEILINKAEMLSGQATERIAVWAEQDIDRELRELVKVLEEQKRLPPPDEPLVIETTTETVYEVEIISEEVLADEP